MKETRKLIYQNEGRSAIKKPNYIEISIYIESGCSFEDGEYEKYFTGHCPWSDFEKIEECIDNELHGLLNPFPIEENIVVTVMEDGEWEDVHFWKYFIISKIEKLDIELTDEEEEEMEEESGTWSTPSLYIE